MTSWKNWSRALLLCVVMPGLASAGGTLRPVGSPEQPIRILDHQVDVVINNGFARTEVIQTFFNPNAQDLEAIYAFPVPKSASLSEVTIRSGETQVDGEVVSKEDADRIYRSERDSGNEAGLARKNSYRTFEFFIASVRGGAETQLRFVYYEPLVIDSGIGRYVYPLEDGGVDDLAASFWLSNEKVDGTFLASIELKSAEPVAEVRLPGLETVATVEQRDEGHYLARVEQIGASLSRDLVFYYRLHDGLPGRIEMIPYRPDAGRPGHFMLVVTPGIDLAPLSGGSDFVFVLDVSGSMAGKIQTLMRGVSKAIGELRPQDRFRVVTFNSTGRELTLGWEAATPENVERATRMVEALRANGGTNVFEGLQIAFERLDNDRATSVVLITDAVTNVGVVDPRDFHALVSRYDVRFFGFLLGNSGNWPLMRTICDATGGFYTGVSNADDILGQILLAKSKLTHEALHGVNLEIRGVKVMDATGEHLRKIYRGQQLVIFGRYDSGGEARVVLKARITGEDKTYATTIEFPDVATDHPEVERLYGMAKVEELERLLGAGLLPASEGDSAIRDLGLRYQLVTDETSMLVLGDDAFARHGIERRNRARISVEREAQTRRAAAPIRSQRVDRDNPMFNQPAPGVGGGALDPLSALLGLGLAGLAGLRIRRKRREHR